MKSEVDLLKEISEKLTELVTIASLANRAEVSRILSTEIDSKEKRLVYELLDGNRSVREISAATAVNISTISKWSQRWAQVGIISEESGVQGRRKKIFDLDGYIGAEK
jgi:Trp operon repressor